MDRGEDRGQVKKDGRIQRRDTRVALRENTRKRNVRKLIELEGREKGITVERMDGN